MAALVAAIHNLDLQWSVWMAGTSPAMTIWYWFKPNAFNHHPSPALGEGRDNSRVLVALRQVV